MNWKEQLKNSSWKINGSHLAVSIITAEETCKQIIEKIIQDLPDMKWKESNHTWQTTDTLKQQLKNEWL